MPDAGFVFETVPSLILDPEAPLNAAREFISRHHRRGTETTIHHQNATFFTWVESHYVEASPEEIRASLYDFLDKAVYVGPKEKVFPFNPNRTKVANVLEALRAECQLSSCLRAPAWLYDNEKRPAAHEMIACRNGLLRLTSGELIDHTPDFFNVNALDFDYRSDAAKPAEWLAFLETLWPDDPDSIATLQEMFGLLLTADTSHQKAFLIVGPKRSGKGTIARVLTRLLNQANVCGPTLSSLGQNFGIAPLIGKRLAIISDARLGSGQDQQVIVERILAITGEDSLTIDRKYREPWTGQLATRFLILTNELPRLSDASGALASRFIILVLRNSFYGKEDHTLTARLTAELPGILLWAIEGWKRLQEYGYLAMPASSLEAQQELDDLGSPIGAFVRDRCTVQPGLQIPCADLYSEWLRWCHEQNRQQVGTLQTFGRDLRAAVPGLKATRPRSDNGNRDRVYQGIDIYDLVRDGPRSRAL